MGIAAPVLGAVGTISQVSAQSRQASAQRAQIEANRLAARQQHELNLERFRFSKQSAEQTYLREKAVRDQMTTQVQQQLQMANLQQGLQNIQQETARNRFSADIDQRVSQMLAGADTVRGQASAQNIQVYQALAQQLYGDDQQANEFIQRLILGGQAPEAASQLIQESLLQGVAAMQAAQQTANTNTRVAGARAEGLEAQASITEQYGSIVSQLQSAQSRINNQFQSFVQDRMPNILDLQAQRNEVAAQAARYAQQAELAINQSASNINYQNQMATANAQSRSIQGPNVLGALANIGAQTVPFILDAQSQRQQLQAAQPQVGFTAPGDFLGGSNFIRTANRLSNAPAPAPVNPVQYPTIQDVPANIPVFG